MPAYKYTLKDGKTQLWAAAFYYVDWTGKKRHVCKRGFKREKDAKAYEQQFREGQGQSSNIVFSALVSNYLDDIGHRLKPTTMQTKRYLIDLKILPYFKDQKTDEITPLMIRNWQNKMLEEVKPPKDPKERAAFEEKIARGRKKPVGESYSQTYLKTINNQFSAIMNYAIRHYGLSTNPVVLAGSIGKSKADEMNFWTEEQYLKFREVIKRPGTRLAFDVLYYCGLRLGELLALTPGDFSPELTIRINKNFVVVKGVELIQTPKTARGIRTFDIPKFLYDEVQEYVSMLYGITDDDRIFYFTKSAVEKAIHVGADKAGLPHIRVHDLRHSNAALLIHLGISPYELSRRLGHESIKTTMDTYGHLWPKEKGTQDFAATKLQELRPDRGLTDTEEDVDKNGKNESEDHS